MHGENKAIRANMMTENIISTRRHRVHYACYADYTQLYVWNKPIN